MPQYREIYNHIVESDQRYNLAENSPGFRAVIKATDRLNVLSGKSLDVGCGVGFVVEYLSSRSFNLVAHGVDVSDNAIAKARMRISGVPGISDRLHIVHDQGLPFEDDFFDLVTCFDMLEHLDPQDIDTTLEEIDRVLKPGGLFFGSVSCRTSGVEDQFGDNLHRTVKSPDWWIQKLSPDTAEYDGQRVQMAFWKLSRMDQPNKKQPLQTEQKIVRRSSGDSAPDHPRPAAHGPDSADLYQRIYEENPWYGNADEGRCPGVRLLPEYQDWLIGPVLDMGCGRGQTVDHLRKKGIEAEGIDQIKINPEMRVGDITKPIADITDFSSVVCIDCIEHLYDDQVAGLFENMKQVKRQVFSIHNGPSNGTGQELHVNRKDFVDWTKIIREHFDIASAIQTSPEQVLYLTQTKEVAEVKLD